MYSKFNTMNDPYWVPMIDTIANFEPRFKPPSMHELRTWILKEELNDINIMMEEHKKSQKQYGCSIMSNSQTDGKNRYFINFLVNGPTGTRFMKSIDGYDTIKKWRINVQIS